MDKWCLCTECDDGHAPISMWMNAYVSRMKMINIVTWNLNDVRMI